MHWPLAPKPIPASQIPFYNLHYLYGCRPPADPTIVWGTEVPAEQLKQYVRQRNRSSKTLISLAHVLVQAVGRALKHHPELNRRIVGRRIYDFRDVNVRMMTYNRQQNEVEVLLIRNVDTLSLERIARILWKNQHRAASGDTTDHADKAWLRSRFPGPLVGLDRPHLSLFGQQIQLAENRPHRPHRLLAGPGELPGILRRTADASL